LSSKAIDELEERVVGPNDVLHLATELIKIE